MIRSRKEGRAFTLIELLVSISIFFVLTALLVAKYGTFNNGVLLTDLAYDVALAIRSAQTYGISVQGTTESGAAVTVGDFKYPYGVTFCADPAGCPGGLDASGNVRLVKNDEIVMFADVNAGTRADPVGAYNGNDVELASYKIKRGAVIKSICINPEDNMCDSLGGLVQRVDISFIRPNPDAIICRDVSGTGQPNNCQYGTPTSNPPKSQYIRIVVQAPDGTTRSVRVNDKGQISVLNI